MANTDTVKADKASAEKVRKEQVRKDEFEEVINFWTETLAPANPVEKHLTISIARQDYLMSALLQSAIKENLPPTFPHWMRAHADMAITLDALIHSLDTLQRQRLGMEPTPPSPRSKAKAKVLPFPKQPSVAAVGRPRKIQLEPEPVPSISPFSRFHERERGPKPALDFNRAA